jgi:hypothetical protein
MSNLLNMINGGASADRPVSPCATMLRDPDRQSQPLSIHPLNGARPQALAPINTANNQPQRSANLLSRLLSSRRNRSQPDAVPLFQPRPPFRPIPIRAPGVVVDHSQTNDTSNLHIPVDILPQLNTGAPQPQLGASAFQTPHSDHIIINQPHRAHGLRNILGSPAYPLPRRVVELRSPPGSNRMTQLDTPVTNTSQTDGPPNLLASPIDIIPRTESRQLSFIPGPRGIPRKEIVVAKRRLNPLAQTFVPSWLVSPPLFSSTNPYRDLANSTPVSTPGLTPDHSPLLDNVPRRVLNYTSFPELTPEHIESIKAELLRNPPILVPSEHPKRPSPGLFLHGTPPPGLTRHTACNPYHPSGIRNLPLPPVRFVEDPSEDHVRFHSAGMIQVGGLEDTKYLQDDGELFWQNNSDLVWNDFVAREEDPFSFGNPTCMVSV